MQQLFLAPLATILPSIFWVFQLFRFLFTRSLWSLFQMLLSDAAVLGASYRIHPPLRQMLRLPSSVARCLIPWPSSTSFFPCWMWARFGAALIQQKNWALWGRQLGGDLLPACPFDLCLPAPLVFCWVYRLLETCFPFADRCLLRLDFFKKPDPCASLIRGCPAFGQAVPMGSISFSEEDTVELIYSLMEASWELIWLRWNFQTSNLRRVV